MTNFWAWYRRYSPLFFAGVVVSYLTASFCEALLVPFSAGSLISFIAGVLACTFVARRVL